jgi:hypothetical protein
LKLEELFEELLLSMMEEYATSQAAGILPPTKPPKMGAIDLWKAWLRRRRTLQHIQPAGQPFHQQQIPQQSDLLIGRLLINKLFI